MPVHKRYAQAAPLFLNHPDLNRVVITHEYEKYPNDVDRAYLIDQRYDKVFNPMAPPRRFDWFRSMHQTQRVLDDYGLPGEIDPQIRLTRWFDVESQGDTIAFAPFAGSYNPANDKQLSFQHAQDIVDLIIMRGYKVIQIGGPGEPYLQRTRFPQTSYFDSIRTILGCQLFVHTDTGSGWAISGYQHPQLGLYSHAYYGREFVKNIQPVNPNGRYLSEENVNQITLDAIGQAMDDMGL